MRRLPNQTYGSEKARAARSSLCTTERQATQKPLQLALTSPVSTRESDDVKWVTFSDGEQVQGKAGCITKPDERAVLRGERPRSGEDYKPPRGVFRWSKCFRRLSVLQHARLK